MKRIIIASLALLISLSCISAENVHWVGFDPADGSWDNSLLLAFTDGFEKGSEIMVSSKDEKTITVKVEGPLPKTNKTRDLALTRSALEELGLWGEGVSEVSVKLRKGSVKEEVVLDETGWYTFVLKGVVREDSYNYYKVLNRKGFKTESIIGEDNLIHFTLPYIAEYEREDIRNLLSSLGLEIEEEMVSPNPYLD